MPDCPALTAISILMVYALMVQDMGYGLYSVPLLVIQTELYHQQRKFPSTNATLLYAIHSQAVSVYTHVQPSISLQVHLRIDHLAPQGGTWLQIFSWMWNPEQTEICWHNKMKGKIYLRTPRPSLSQHAKIRSHRRKKHLKKSPYLQDIYTRVAGTAIIWSRCDIVNDFPLFFGFGTF